MKTTVQWLDEAKAKHGLSDYALAPMLGLTRGQISKYRTGRDYLSDDAALKLAGVLGLKNPRAIIASAHAERAKSEDVRHFWERLAGVAATVALAVGVGTAPSPAQASTAVSAVQSVYYVNQPMYIQDELLPRRSHRPCHNRPANDPSHPT